MVCLESFYIQNNIINRYIIQVMILFCFDETLQCDKKKDQLTVSIRIKNMVLFIFAPYMIGRCPRFVVFRLSRTRNIQEHMIRIYLVVVNCELIDRAGLNNPQLWDTQKSLCSRFSNVPSSAYKVLTKPFMPFSIFKNIPNPISKCWRFIACDIFNLILSMASIFFASSGYFRAKIH